MLIIVVSVVACIVVSEAAVFEIILDFVVDIFVLILVKLAVVFVLEAAVVEIVVGCVVVVFVLGIVESAVFVVVIDEEAVAAVVDWVDNSFCVAATGADATVVAVVSVAASAISNAVAFVDI